MPTLNRPVTYNDAALDLKSRAVFAKAMDAAEEMIDGKTTMNPEKLHALAAAADAAACGFDNSDEKENEYD